MREPAPQARLTVDLAAMVANWRDLAAAGRAECGAAIKADAYGLGARAAMKALAAAGCRHFYVAHWAEVAALLPLPPGVSVSVLHGAAPHEIETALSLPATPVLATPAQVAAWRQTGRPCEAMVDTGMNRLGLAPAEAQGLLAGLTVTVLHSHLACAEQPGHPLNDIQRQRFAEVAAAVPAGAYALANSSGIALGPGWLFDRTRPGIALFGGGLLPGGRHARTVASLSARVLQVHDVAVGASVGYGATFVAARPSRIATLALGYADGYRRALSNKGCARIGGVTCPAAGRVSMDMAAFDVTDAPPVAEGEWVDVDFDLAGTAALAGASEYELLTGLGGRYARVYR
ncbi:alanine racemase [Sandarakinorhabdus sp.]|uniref:alanine racemase n=1 Tax=Sandarakinorhabdus sp. TaxID=1916663 RepID=UPI00286D9D5E|nr:alanine racemase [Sandarakinorhabdus sp.]